MTTLNLSSNGPSISKSYQTVVNSSLPASSPTYSQWAVFSVSTPLINAFQPDAGNKESVLKVQNSGEGELVDLIDEFSEGKIQFAFAKVTDPNTGLPKNVLIAWCGEGVPERTKGYFTSHLSAVSKFLHGYHVQITARSDADLTVEGIVKKVSDASGAKYTSENDQSISTTPKPPVSTKPVFTPSRSGGTALNKTPAVPLRGLTDRINSDDGWGPDAPPVTRTQLEKVQPAYKPTKVNMDELKSEKEATSGGAGPATANSSNVVKGGYQPVGKVDIAAIRRQARETGNLQDDRPEPVKGAYEPVGKVDIAAIRSKAQTPKEHTVASDNKFTTPSNPPIVTPKALSEQNSERLTSLPKPKVSNKFGTTPAFTGTRPPLPNDSMSKPTSSPLHGASRTFADQGGKTPAQLWAEKKARERGEDSAYETPVNRETGGNEEWKSSSSVKPSDAVQTMHAGQTVGNSTSHDAAVNRGDSFETEPRSFLQQEDTTAAAAASHVDTAVESVEQDPSPVQEAKRPIPAPELVSEPVQQQAHNPDNDQLVPETPEQASPRSPSPPAREASPIRVAMPVSREATEPQAEQGVNSSVSQPDEIQHTTSNQYAPEDDLQDVAQGRSQAPPENLHHKEGIQAIAQYDYDKAEDNELELREGEHVVDIDMVDKDWWLGSNVRGERGLFPSNYVEIVEHGQQSDNPSDVQDIHGADKSVSNTDSTAAVPSVAHSTLAPSAVALYDYEAAEDNELSFPEGAQITNIEFPDDDWWFGEFHGKKGLFPANYVQIAK
ncbi:putative actin binding protein [Aspergillus melleus]|uniref:putative actin binding protein n=1 Tax=Aspergillus melleus TaxID=138277 RepID=UPI001E8E890E|nr:actin binding protein [Aspergillus melleus]KAH8432538.1 actin binding protein [Aspergillus melleus]